MSATGRARRVRRWWRTSPTAVFLLDGASALPGVLAGQLVLHRAGSSLLSWAVFVLVLVLVSGLVHRGVQRIAGAPGREAPPSSGLVRSVPPTTRRSELRAVLRRR
ncbi:hypothetical protein IQ251_17015 [Saccharopolyspora sp. HNM0983]|uniref:Uncharacterized protein n=1 Tax=Saccharopolyspora montiporae TaxID=2781240 RepID=A0A929BA71_9PSEU|nr:hypothetical protein [Saccharopolyspora sp. HNM0983]MBE9376154.1 hypothetical protein [Saccharopolyspora sp. HNM0983]